MNVTLEQTAVSPGYEVLTFGRFRLDPVQHVLREGDKTLRLGSRALELLIVLTQRTGEVVSKHELIAKVWPKTIVQDSTLRVHIAALRKALGDGESGVRYVENFSGRGYRFVGPVVRQHENNPLIPTSAAALLAPEHQRPPYLPIPLTRMVGRANAVATFAIRIPQCRFITVVGAGGIGNRAVAAAATEKLSGSYEHGIRVLDCSSIMDSRLLPYALASLLDLAPVSAEGALYTLLAFLRTRSMLIVLDNCERVVEAAATVAERLCQAALGVHLLATSREPLRAESEHVHHLAPLGTPASTDRLTRAEALAFPAVQLFIERASASMDSFELHDSDLPLVAQICCRLEGNPLAIELAAARVDVFGIRGLAAGLTDCLRLLTRGRRTALPRHQSLRATLDWSYEMLSPIEQVVLRRLAVFSLPFDIESANVVAADSEVRASHVFDAVTNLVAKSLLMTEASGELYRLPEATRAYGFEKLQEHDEVARTLLLHSETWQGPRNSGQDTARCLEDNLRIPAS